MGKYSLESGELSVPCTHNDQHLVQDPCHCTDGKGLSSLAAQAVLMEIQQMEKSIWFELSVCYKCTLYQMGWGMGNTLRG